ncbi:SDR family NAD(P)-dependent oxidoreductase [Agromyces silvae]|uniref:SDR family NAD(P)-dependent oxidoreductase n=1 Tax=Agromyces silvae TaxID=3388266 RepID=UPI00280AF8C8|nr:SDR family oxidoreductase [Agromyces protaetiae]
MEHSGRFSGQVAVVTGGGGGIGSASARRLSQDGAAVVVVDRDLESAQRVVDSLPGQAIAVAADVSEEAGVAEYIDRAVEAFGRVDLHHLNAGIFGGFTELVDQDVAEFDRVMAVNVRGTFLGVRAAFQRYRTQGTRGAVVLTGSIAGHTGSADLLPYQVSKHAVGGLVHAAAVYGGPLGVRVNAVAPGIVPTALFASAGDGQLGGGNDMVRRASTTPLRRAGTPEEMAGVAAFLLSEDAGYVTGQIVVADGGATIVNTVRPSGGAGAWSTGAVDDAMYGEGWGR